MEKSGCTRSDCCEWIGAPAPACPHVCMGAIGAHVYADTCLLSQCAGDAPSIDTATTAVIAATVAVVAVAAVAVAAPPLLPPSPLPPRRSHVHGAAAPMKRRLRRRKNFGLMRWV